MGAFIKICLSQSSFELISSLNFKLKNKWPTLTGDQDKKDVWSFCCQSGADQLHFWSVKDDLKICATKGFDAKYK